MTDRDREALKNRLRVLAHDQGIRLDTPKHWVINGVTEPRRFFENLSPEFWFLVFKKFSPEVNRLASNY